MRHKIVQKIVKGDHEKGKPHGHTSCFFLSLAPKLPGHEASREGVVAGKCVVVNNLCGMSPNPVMT